MLISQNTCKVPLRPARRGLLKVEVSIPLGGSKEIKRVQASTSQDAPRVRTCVPRDSRATCASVAI